MSSTIKKAVILISGGLDSATTLAMARDAGFECYALSFDYGQKNAIELRSAKQVAKRFSAVEHKIVCLGIGELGGSALTDNAIEVPDFVAGKKDVPVTYVPARNTVFLSIALGWAEILGAQDIFIGVTSQDYSGYPDCRPEYIKAFEQMANLATKAGVEGHLFRINTPLMYKKKSETITIGMQLGVDYSTTITCYNPDNHGHACGHCDSCTFRRKGFEEANVSDPTLYQVVS